MHISPSTCWDGVRTLRATLGCGGGGTGLNDRTGIRTQFCPSSALRLPFCRELFVPFNKPRAPSPYSPLDEGRQYTDKSRDMLVHPRWRLRA